MPFFLDNLLTFGRLLRRAGIDVQPGRMLDVVEALRHVDLSAREEVHGACRALLVHRHEQLALFDRAFDEFWRERHEDDMQMQPASGEPRSSSTAIEEVVLLNDALLNDGREVAPAPERGIKTWSDRGGLADKDFAAFTAEELDEARTALSRLEWNPGMRRTRRWVRGRGVRIDLRRAIAESVRTGGEVVRLPRRVRRIRSRRLVLLCDISGSMEQYSRVLLHFAYALMSRHHRVEAFLFSTRLTRITNQLRQHCPDDAIAAVSRSVHDWSGGTRIGDAVKEFHHRWARRALGGGAVVLLISDGWDRGDPEELRGQIARLQRRCHRLIWLNPLIGTEDYAPLTRGLQAALPFVDDFLPSRTLTNLADLASHLNRLSGGRPKGRHYEKRTAGPLKYADQPPT
jgi:uncharacterized protein with von Willebrand factor type A (vWA) domain